MKLYLARFRNWSSSFSQESISSWKFFSSIFSFATPMATKLTVLEANSFTNFSRDDVSDVKASYTKITWSHIKLNLMTSRKMDQWKSFSFLLNFLQSSLKSRVSLPQKGCNKKAERDRDNTPHNKAIWVARQIRKRRSC